MTTGKVYILHFAEKFHHARHYIGITNIDLAARLQRHKQGSGSRLTAAVVAAGIDFTMHLLGEYETMQQARDHEIKLKKRKESHRFCPVCNEARRSI